MEGTEWREAGRSHCGPVINSARRLGSSLFINRGRSRAVRTNQQSVPHILMDADGGGGSYGDRQSGTEDALDTI